MITYDEFDGFPVELLDVAATTIHQQLKKPTIFHIPGGAGRPLFVSVLLHGNEHTGWYAVQKILKRYLSSERGLPRPVCLLIGNPEAASVNQRMIEGSQDFNRIWTSDNAALPGHLVERITAIVQDKDFMLCLDIHNNTGKNPLYSCTPELSHELLSYCGLFSQTAIFFREPANTQTVYLSQFTKSLTIECGRSRESRGLQRTENFLDALLHLQVIPERLTRPLQVYQTIGRLRLKAAVDIKFTDEPSNHLNQLHLRPDLDELNFSDADEPRLVGSFGGSLEDLIHIDVIADEFELGEVLIQKGTSIYLSEDFIPSMFTLSQKIIHQDCLGYVMKRVANSG